jgi:hypothetical protein
MEHKVDDMVRIQSWDWIDEQEKDKDGDIDVGFVRPMFRYAGKVARIVGSDGGCYGLSIDGGRWNWLDSAFDPSFDPDAILSAKEAAWAMLDGETLHDGAGRPHRFNEEDGCFEYVEKEGTVKALYVFKGFLKRRPPERYWTRWEMLAWANSEESRGWLVAYPAGSGDWSSPQYYNYADLPEQYQRARLLPDLSGIDESTIQGFEAEE